MPKVTRLDDPNLPPIEVAEGSPILDDPNFKLFEEPVEDLPANLNPSGGIDNTNFQTPGVTPVTPPVEEKPSDIVSETEKALESVTAFADTDEGKAALTDLENLRNSIGNFSAEEQTRIESASGAASAAFDPIITEAEESRRKGIPKALIRSGERGGLLSTQEAGTSAILTNEQEGFLKFFGQGGQLKDIQNVFDRNIQNLKSQQIVEVNRAREAARTAIRTGKREDLVDLQNAVNLARQLNTDANNLVLEKQKAIQQAQKFQADQEAQEVEATRISELTDQELEKGKVEIELLKQELAGGVGLEEFNALSTQQQLEAKSLSVEIFGKRAGIKDENVQMIAKLMNEGKDIDTIKDNLRFAGQSEKFTGSFRDAAELISIGFSVAQEERFNNTLDRSLESGDIERTKDVLTEGVLDSLPSGEARERRGEMRTVELVDEIATDLKAYEDAGGKTGIFSGTHEIVAEKIGRLKDDEIARIANKIQLAIQKYRKAISGAAFTESESLEYRSVFPSISNTKELNSAKMESLKEVMKGNVDFVMSKRMGSGAFDDIFGGSVFGDGTTSTPTGGGGGSGGGTGSSQFDLIPDL